MAVTPFKTFSAGEVLTASDLNSSFSQVFDNGEDLGWPATQAKDLNGQEFILDADGDTSITADTDDQIDFKLAGTDYITITQVATTDTVNVNGSVATTGNVFNSTNADALTTGGIIDLVSNSSDTSIRTLGHIHNDHADAVNATCLTLTQDLSASAAASALRIDNGGDSRSIVVVADSTTTESAIFVTVDGLTSGKALEIVSNSSDTTTRTLGQIHNDHADAVNVTCLTLTQDLSSSSVASALRIDNNGDSRSIAVVADSTTTESAIFVTADGLTTGKALEIVSDSSSGSTRELVTIHNNDSSATSATCLELIQDASFRAMLVTTSGSAAAIDMNVTGNAFDIDCSLIGGPIIDANGTNNSFANVVFNAKSNRTSSNLYSFLNGVSDTDGTPDQEVLLRGDGECLCDGAFTGGGADYAEFFEWLDGNPDNEDRRGVSVSLVGNKIVPAATKDQAFGVVSANPSIVGDAAWNKWDGKYLKDDFGSYIFEDYEVWTWDERIEAANGSLNTKTYDFVADRIPDDIVVPEDKTVVVQQRRKLNPSWEKSVEYIPREKRKEWACVGIMGKLRIRNDQLTNPSWVKMQDISNDVSEWLIK